MAISQVIDGAQLQTANGQPIRQAENDGAETTTTVSESTDVDKGSDNAAGGTTETTTEVSANGDKPADAKTAEVNFSPEALRHITSLSSQNRQLRKQVKEFETKLASAAQPADVTKQLDRLKELEAVLKSPRAYLAATGKTLEDVAADVFAAGNEVVDPRVDAIKELVGGINKRLDALDENSKKKETETVTHAQAEARAQSVIAAKSLIAANPDRWEHLAKDDKAPEEAVKAAIMIVQRDYAEKKDAEGKVIRVAKQLDKATADKIFNDCLDQAEALALAAEIVEQRKNGGQRTETVARSRGIRVREEEGKPANPAPPRPSAGATRGPTRTVAQVQRGPTDVRTARARAMKIAGAD